MWLCIIFETFPVTGGVSYVSILRNGRLIFLNSYFIFIQVKLEHADVAASTCIFNFIYELETGPCRLSHNSLLLAPQFQKKKIVYLVPDHGLCSCGGLTRDLCLRCCARAVAHLRVHLPRVGAASPRSSHGAPGRRQRTHRAEQHQQRVPAGRRLGVHVRFRRREKNKKRRDGGSVLWN